MGDWLANHVTHLRGLKAPSDQQKLLLALFDRPDRTTKEEKAFKALIRAEKANERAKAARADAARIVDDGKAAARKARDHNLYQTAGLLTLSGLVDPITGEPTRDKAMLLGAFIQIAASDNPALWARWKEKGEALLAERSASKKTSRDRSGTGPESRENSDYHRKQLLPAP